jgi:DNA-repair protein complementing XP-A cells
MALTEEQQERMRTNKERALEIRRRKEEEAEAKQQQQQEGVADTNNTTQIRSSNNTNNIKISTNEPKSVIKIQIKNDKQEPDDNVELEEFEIDASPYVTKNDAMKLYCLPTGTLEVCEFVEKDNPRNQKFSRMKLYDRNEIRRRARERFGGLDGLKEERGNRERKRFERDFEDVNNIFKSERKKKKSGK